MISSFDDIILKAKSKKKKKIVVAAAEDEAVLSAVKLAWQEGIVTPILVGDEFKIKDISHKIDFQLSEIEIIPQNNPVESSRIAVQYIKSQKADLLMKGLVATAPLLKAVLDKDTGIKKSAILSHIALFQSPYYHKLLGVTDAAMNIAPTLEEKIGIINNAVEIFQKLDIACPKVAVVCPVETVNEKILSTTEAAMLSKMNERGQIKNCIIDGPLALDNAISKEAAMHKGIKSEVSGDVDLLVANDLDSGNILYKSLIFLGGAQSAAVITGAQVPVVLTSRADSEKSKLFSIALGAILS